MAARKPDPAAVVVPPTLPEPLSKQELELAHAFMMRSTLEASEAFTFVQLMARIERLINVK
jgi:hypothetical protein